MWVYEKRLEYPVKIKCRNPKMAKYIITQYGGPDGELAASLRYLSQRFSIPTDFAKATLNDIGISLSIWRIYRYATFHTWFHFLYDTLFLLIYKN